MYTEHFGLTEKPFSISPDPRYLYLSQRHADALAHLIYGISESGGFIQLTGEVGTGKTTLIRSLLEQLPEKTEIALVLNPPLTTREFLFSICQELRIDAPTELSVKSLIDRLNEHLLAANAEDGRVVLIVDEAQTLSPELLEQVRLLTNLETSKRKLLQIILIGQPELRELLDRPGMRQIAQRITGRYHLEPLSAGDTRIYIRHRLRVAGSHSDVFSDRAMRELYRLAGGIPRLINVLADRALLAAYTRDERRIGVRLVRQAAQEVFGRSLAGRRWAWFGAAATAVGVAAIVTGLALGLIRIDQPGNVFIGEEPAARLTPDAQATTGRPAGADPAAGPLPVAIAEPALIPANVLADALGVRSDAGSPGGEWVQRESAEATSALFAQWGLAYSVQAGDPCKQALAVGLRCLSLPEASLADLRQIDRPVVLELNDVHGRSHESVLTALGYDFAELIVGDQNVRVSIVELTHAWFGEHWLLWRPATDVTADLQPGMRSERVVWLREALASFRGESISADVAADPTLFDALLERWVRDYQRLRHLWVDGVVGAQTQVALQADIGHRTGPTLNGGP